MSKLPQTLNVYKERINRQLSLILSHVPTSNLQEAMSYAVQNGGKRLRPILVYATGEALGAELKILDIPAAAIECMHCFSLIHDDLPSMDDDDLRRGKPSCHKAFGEAIAILAGDALQTLSFEILSENNSFLSSQQVIQMISILSKASGASGMGYGQMLDIANQQNITIEQLDTLHQAKTGKILESCVHFGIIAANCKDPQRISYLLEYAKNIGLGFQIYDDILDIEGQTKTLGKPAGSDEKLNKTTYPNLVGLENSKKIIGELLDRALRALESASLANSKLAEIALFIVDRDH